MISNIEYVNTLEVLQDLYKSEAITIRGLAESAIPDLENWILQRTDFIGQSTIYVIKGGFINSTYNLTGDNQYNDNLTIVAIKASDMEKPDLVIKDFKEIRANYFNVIIDNDIMRENMKVSE